ncbi:Uncharacterised protein [uncultured Ruminococcus sp.]|jgi:hypothetical protein|nr:hypothetical protein [uncultured Ruminococcus sp.]SCI86109.1 Uncharacterised protein [uncultured Ruminococcus sp.]
MAKRIRMNEVPCWQEERNFTKWLADNIDCVGNTIGRNIVSACTEVKESSEYGKGKYPVDILAIDENDEKIVVENQYFLSNHIHLGEILTYSAWNSVSTIVWITEDIDEEHFRAVEYIKELAQSSDRKLEFWILLMSPDENSDLLNDPKVILKVATKDDCIKRDSNVKLPINAELYIEFWNRFESVVWKYGFSLSRQGRKDCINLRWGKSYEMNVPFRKNNINIEVNFKKFKTIFYDAIDADFDSIVEELCLGKYYEISLNQYSTYSQIRVKIPAQVENIDKWDEYIERMIGIILKLREIADRYEFCY